MDTVLRASDLVKHYKGVRAVDGLELEVHRGDIFGFLGPNGAGKSTTIRMAVGLIHPTAGHISILGHDVWRNRRSALRDVGALVENPSFFKYLTGRENLNIMGRLSGKHSRAEVDRVLEEIGLAERADSKVKTYSHGMQQRLGIGAAMLGRPQFIILDEPTNGLDPQGMNDVRKLIRELAEKHSMTIFLSSHLLHEVEQICSKVAIINRGKVLVTGGTADLLAGADMLDVSTPTPGEAARLVDRLEWASVARVSEDGITVGLSDGQSAELNRLLVTAGIEVSALVPKRRTLEELYLKVTGSVDTDQA